jgi:hypothetical protein
VGGCPATAFYRLNLKIEFPKLDRGMIRPATRRGNLNEIFRKMHAAVAAA